MLNQNLTASWPSFPKQYQIFMLNYISTNVQLVSVYQLSLFTSNILVTDVLIFYYSINKCQLLQLAVPVVYLNKDHRPCTEVFLRTIFLTFSLFVAIAAVHLKSSLDALR